MTPTHGYFGTAMKYAFLTLFGLLMLSPLFFAAYTSFESPAAYMDFIHPSRFSLSNYRYVLENAPLVRWYANTVFVTAAVVVGAILFNTMAGYALSRLRFPGRTLGFLLVLAVLMVPLQAILIPQYLLITRLGWLNTYQALIVPFMANPFLIFLMRQSFLTLPVELEEAAIIDGAGPFTIFLRIAVPNVLPGIATQAILAATWTWNSFMIPVTYTTDPGHYVLTVGLNSLQSQFYTLPTVQMAGVVLLTVPVVVMYLVFQRLIVPSVATSGIRG